MPKTTTSPKTDKPDERAAGQLTAADLDALRTWRPDAFELPVHAVIRFQMSIGMDGIEGTVIHGPRGVGKSHALDYLSREVELEEVEKARASGGTHIPRRIYIHVAAESSSPKGALVDLYEALTRHELSTGARRGLSPKKLQLRIVEELMREEYHLVAIDEAQFYDAADIDLLRQIPDLAQRTHGYALSLMLVGSEELRETVVQTGQLGQRLATEVNYPRVTRADIGPFLPDFHPHLPGLREELGAARWEALEADLFAKVNGKFRRLATILANANAIALQNGRRISEGILRTAIDKLASEV